MTTIQSVDDLVRAVAYAALARRKAEHELEEAQRTHLKYGVIRQKMIAAAESDRYLRKLTEELASVSNGDGG